MSYSYIDAAALDRRLAQAGELAVIDLRTPAQFGKWGAPLHAANLPYEHLERDIGWRVPRRDTELVLVDDGGPEGHAVLAAHQLEALGYGAVQVLDGGFPAWLASGLTGSFSVTGNDYSEQLRAQYQPPSVTVQELRALHEQQRDVIVFDTRAPEEYNTEHVPGAVSVPGAELVQRFGDLAPRAETLIVVSCALLARAILGAQTLINAGVPNRVVYLHEGTKAWREAGYELEHGASRSYGAVTAAAGAYALHAVQRLRQPAATAVDLATIGQWQGEGDRTTYLIDVRSPEEYAAGHVAGALSAPGGQLILGTFRYLAVRGARLVLLDDNGVRATTTAHWLIQRGWDVHVHHTEAALLAA